MQFALLGPLEANDGAGQIRFGGRKQRALLARLLLDANRTVATERLVDDLWGDEVPESAQKMVQIYVSQLRKLLPEGMLQTRPPGYALAVDLDSIDSVRFERLRREAEAAHGAGNAELAVERFREALDLWRGEPLGELSEPFARVEAGRLEELYLACVESRIDADLELGRHSDLVAELEVLVARHPLREELRAQQLLALYRSGRQPDALAAYQTYRALLDADLGLEPSARLKELERRILRQDPGLDLETPGGETPRRVPAHDVRYVRSGDLSIAYQVVGSGDVDLVLVHGWVCTFQPGWERPQIASFYEGLTRIGRLIQFDKRGTGLSDRLADVSGLDERMDDVRAVMDAAGSERAVLLGISEGGSMAALFAATYPERTAGMVLMGTFARRRWAPDYTIGVDSEQPWWNGPEEWGLPMARRFVDERVPSAAGDEEAYRWYASYLVRGASPGAALHLSRMNAEIDVRHILPSIHVPTLVLYRRGEYLRKATRYMGERIPGARVVALPGADHLPWEGAQQDVLREITGFVAGLSEENEPDRVLTTVLVVEADGTAEACDLVRLGVARYRGVELELTDDTLVATFDGPARAIRCASAMLQLGRSVGRPARAGLHTGEHDLGVDPLEGVPVAVARALKDRAEPGEVLVSSTVRDLVAGSGLPFGNQELQPLQLPEPAGEWRVHAVAI
jgi:DNA-binding SARP family transcriptional activator/pimeloyl-ACP methyl ester carboxylesterase